MAANIILLKNNVKFVHSLYYWLPFFFLLLKRFLSNTVVESYYDLEKIERCLIFFSLNSIINLIDSLILKF